MRKLSTRIAAKQAGFTMVELVIVIVIIGILAAVAIPNYMNVSDDAGQAGAYGVGGAISAASANNYTAKKGGLSGSTVATCTAAGALLAGGMPNGYTISTGNLNTDGTPATCTVTHTRSTKTAVIQAWGST